jgi:ABC-type multidrug transport system fused ATPase/permease subunit
MILADINMGELLWSFLVIFFMVMYFMILFSILGDLFRDKKTNGWVKAIWVLALIIFPFLAALIYLIVRGGGMSERAIQAQKDAQAQMQEYARTVVAQGGDASGSATDQIAQAKNLLDSGAISQEEFAALKAKALAG